MGLLKRLLIFLSAFLLSISFVVAGSVCGGSYNDSSGSWIISSNVTCNGENFTVNGNITIDDDGNLTLNDTIINMGVPLGQNVFIDVKQGADDFRIIDSTIQSDSFRDYHFSVSGPLYVRNAHIEDIGRQGFGPREGLRLRTDKLDVKGLTVKDGERGIIIEHDNVKLFDVTVDTTDGDAIFIPFGDNVLLEDCTIIEPGVKDIHIGFGAVNDIVRVRSCSFNKNNVGVESDSSEMHIQWRADVFTNNTNGTLPNASVNITNKDNFTVAYGQTDSNGLFIGTIVLEEIVKKGPNFVNNPHTFSATFGNEFCIEEVTVVDDLEVLDEEEVVLELGSSGCGTGG